MLKLKIFVVRLVGSFNFKGSFRLYFDGMSLSCALACSIINQIFTLSCNHFRTASGYNAMSIVDSVF